MLYKFLFGIDDSDVMQVKRWTELSLDDPHGPIGQDAQVKWNNWLHELIATRRATRKSHLPFGPFMIAGALAVILIPALSR